MYMDKRDKFPDPQQSLPEMQSVHKPKQLRADSGEGSEQNLE
jgi:hypothetical protein